MKTLRILFLLNIYCYTDVTILIFRGSGRGQRAVLLQRSIWLHWSHLYYQPNLALLLNSTQMPVKDQKSVQIRHSEAGVHDWEVRESGSVDVS